MPFPPERVTAQNHCISSLYLRRIIFWHNWCFL